MNNMIKLFKQTAFWFISLSLLTLAGCDKTPHEMENLPEDGAGITVGVNTDAVADKSLRDVHLFFFDASDKLARHDYYDKMENLALDRILLEEGFYTIFAILNTEPGLMPTTSSAQAAMAQSRADKLPKISLTEFKIWAYKLPDKYPDLLTGMVRREVTQGVERILIDIKPGSEAVELTQVTLEMTFPLSNLSDFVMPASRAAGTDVHLRTVTEAYLKGTDNMVVRQEKFVTPTATEGIYTTDLLVPPGDYDLRIWSDYTSDQQADNHYTTSDTKMIKALSKEAYIANTDTRDAFAQTAQISVAKENIKETITMHRPLAKYRLIATDVAEYEEMRLRRGFPPLNELTMIVSYEGFLPCAYNMIEGKPNDAQTGYRYTSALSEQSDNTVTVGKDFIFVNGSQSAVTVNVQFRDKDGKTISGMSGIKIDYKAGYLTTVRGEFLTAGVGGGVNIDTEWEDIYEVEF